MTHENHFYLVVVGGAQKGAHFPLDPAQPSRLGRDTECEIVLADPVCSRVHAELWQDSQGWWMRDLDSRNGTYVDDQRIERVRLVHGSQVRMGTTELVFHATEQPLTSPWETGMSGTQALEREDAIDAGQLDSAFIASAHASEVDPQQLLYRLSLRLLGAVRPEQVIHAVLELLHHQTHARQTAFYWLHEEGRLRVRFMLPERCAAHVAVQRLAEYAARQGRAYWSARHAELYSPPPDQEVIAIPLVYHTRVLGVVVLVDDPEAFTAAQFELARLATILVTGALVRVRQLVSLKADRQRLVQNAATFDELIGDSPAVRKLKDQVQRAADGTGCVLICGEPGSGRELVARAIHRASARADRPMISVNCATLPPEVISQQLFGHREPETGRMYPGLFQQADSGTLLLGEIGQLAQAAQQQVLQILKGDAFYPLGAGDPLYVDVRVIATAAVDGLQQEQSDRQQQLIDELQGRLTCFELKVPPLRERRSDIAVLTEFLLDHFRKLHGRPQLVLSTEAHSQLLQYSWPGNVRQLRNVLDTAVVVARNSTIGVAELMLGVAASGAQQADSLRIQDWEKWLIRRALEATGGKVPEAAELLGIGRATLYRKLDEYQITER